MIDSYEGDFGVIQLLGTGEWIKEWEVSRAACGCSLEEYREMEVTGYGNTEPGDLPDFKFCPKCGTNLERTPMDDSRIEAERRFAEFGQWLFDRGYILRAVTVEKLS